jgi:hypothetical protein
MKSAYITIHLGKNPPPQNGCRLKSFFIILKYRFHILHFPNSTGLFTKPTGRHYTKYRFSSDIACSPAALLFQVAKGHTNPTILKNAQLIVTSSLSMNWGES